MANFDWLNEASELFLQRGYLREGVTGEQRVREIADAFAEKAGKEYGDKFYDYMSKGFYSLSSPIWGNYGPQSKAYSVSCFGTYFNDSIPSILKGTSEIGSMSQKGGGCSGYMSNIRARGEKVNNGRGSTSGVVHFLELFETLTSVISQSGVRRGFFTPYLDAEHGDAKEFIRIGSEGHPIQTLTSGLNLSDSFMESLLNKDMENLSVWAEFIKNRKEVGYPYAHFTGNANNYTVDVYKDKGMEIVASNMCQEIELPSSPDESFVCVLSSMNALKWDEWKDTDAVKVLARFLDTVVDDFTDKLEAERDRDEDGAMTFENMKRAYRFAKRHRALGIGSLGLHDLFMSKMIPFDSEEADALDLEIHKKIQEDAWEESQDMAKHLGEPEVLEGYGRRNTTLTAIAPTKSSSFLLGQVSQGVEPRMSNYYIEDLAKTKDLQKNKYLKALLEEKGMDTRDVWKSIASHDGSVKHLVGEGLTEYEAEVFATFGEISPYAVVDKAAARQAYVDQGQSINLMLGSTFTPRELSQLYIHAWKTGLKGLYYSYNTNSAQELTRKSACASCSL